MIIRALAKEMKFTIYILSLHLYNLPTALLRFKHPTSNYSHDKLVNPVEDTKKK